MADIIMGEVDEVVENFAQTEGAGKPLLLPCLVATWPACSLWRGESGLRHLLKAFDGTFVQVMQSDSSVFWGDIHNHHPVNMNMSEFLEDAEVVLTGGDPSRYLYLAQHHLHHQHHEGKSSFTILNEVPAPSCLAGKSLSSLNLWMSTKGSRSSLHYDLSDNLLCVVSGSKTVTMYPPSQTPYLYPRPISDESNNHSQVNFANPDYERHPLYKQAVDHRSVFELKEGDALFIPSGWWHQVDSTDVTIAVNFWWEAVPEVQNLRRYQNQRQGQAGGVDNDGYSFFFLRRSMTEAIVDMMHHMVKELPLVGTLRSQSASRPSVLGPQVNGDCNGHPVASYCQATTADYHGGLPGSNAAISCTTPGDVLSAHHAAALFHEQLPSSLTKSRSCQCLPLASNMFISIIGSGSCGDDAVGQPPSATNVQLLPAAGTSSVAPGAGTATAVAADTSSSMVSISDNDEQMRMTRNQDLEPLNRYETVTIIIGGDASKATDETANPPAAASSTAATVSDTATAIATAASTDAATATTVTLLTTPGTAATASVGVNATGTVKATATFTAPGGAATGTNTATATTTTAAAAATTTTAAAAATTTTAAAAATTTTAAAAATTTTAAAAATTTTAAAAAATVLPPNYSPAHDPLACLFASMSVQHFAALLFSLSTDRPHAIKRLFFDYKDGSHEVSITAADSTGIIDDSIRVEKKRLMRHQEGRRTRIETAVAPHYYHYCLNGSSHEDECSHDCNYSSVEDVIVRDNSTALAELSRHDEDGVVYFRPSCGSTLDSTDRSHELTPFMTPMVAYLMTRMLEEIEEREAVHEEEIEGREAVHIDMLLMNKTGAEVNTHALMVQPQESSTAGQIDSDGPILNPGVTSDTANNKLTDASGSPTVQQGVGGQQYKAVQGVCGQQEDKVTALCVMTVNSNGEAASQPTQALTQSYPSNLVRVSEQTAGHERDGEDGQRDGERGHLVGLLGTREDTAVRDQGCSTARGRTVDVHQQQQRHNHVCNSCGGGFWVPTMSQLCTMLYAAAGDEDRAFAVLLNGRQRLSEEAVSRLKASML